MMKQAWLIDIKGMYFNSKQQHRFIFILPNTMRKSKFAGDVGRRVISAS